MGSQLLDFFNCNSKIKAFPLVIGEYKPVTVQGKEPLMSFLGLGDVVPTLLKETSVQESKTLLSPIDSYVPAAVQLSIEEIVKSAYDLVRRDKKVSYKDGLPVSAGREKVFNATLRMGTAFVMGQIQPFLTPLVTMGLQKARKRRTAQFTRVFYGYFGFPEDDAILLEKTFSDEFEETMLTTAISGPLLQRLESSGGMLPELTDKILEDILRLVKKEGKRLVNAKLSELCTVIKDKGMRGRAYRVGPEQARSYSDRRSPRQFEATKGHRTYKTEVIRHYM